MGGFGRFKSPDKRDEGGKAIFPCQHRASHAGKEEDNGGVSNVAEPVVLGLQPAGVEVPRFVQNLFPHEALLHVRAEAESHCKHHKKTKLRTLSPNLGVIGKK